MPPKNNYLWVHFEGNESKTATCNYCQALLSYKTSTTNLKVHLKTKHSAAYTEYLQQKNSENRKSIIPNFISKDMQQNNKPCSLLWNFFKRDPNIKIAECNSCKKYFSFKTSITNLKCHLKTQHPSDYEEYIKISSSGSSPKSKPAVRRKIVKTSNNPLWKFFIRDPSSPIKAAECKYCHKSLVFRTSITNLKNHLILKHPRAYNKLQELLNAVYDYDSEASDDEDSEASDDEDRDFNCSVQSEEDAEESLKLPDVWNYYEEEADGRARCVVCRNEVGYDYEELKAHLKDNHPKLLLQIMQNKESHSDGASNGADDENTYTEVVYLEQDAIAEEGLTSRETSIENNKRNIPKKTPRVALKRERRISSDEIPLKRHKETTKNDDNDELMSFIKYITCLLKKLTPDAFAKVQIDIINSIMKAKTNSSQTPEGPPIILNNEIAQNNVSKLITVSEITPVNSALLGHNYTISVANKEGNIIKSGETSS